MPDLLDQPRAVRADDRLDTAAVSAWLAERVDGIDGLPEVRQYPGGASNLTYLLTWPDRELVLRRPPFGTKARSAHDMGREVRFLTALRPVYPEVPEVVAHCTDEALGTFYVMERLRGIILRSELPPELGLDAAGTRALCTSVLQKLVALHSLDVAACGLQHLGRGDGYVERQITGWSERYRQARTPGAADGEEVMAWLAEHTPPQVATTVIHGDFRLDNVVLDPADPTRVLAVLDWEMAALGDPLMDLGNSLAYWVQADDRPELLAMRRQPTHAPGMLTREEVWALYGDATGREVSDTLFYELYGQFRLAVILQQIWYRVHHGQSANRAFAQFGALARLLVETCARRLG